ncbi:MAG TPA: SGNH/GDSL hydrolase family protein, partial [Nitrososphaera sp.]|nr:SGNH/GDSL hydrolase family protein [Nitrososphaera sp.]
EADRKNPPPKGAVLFVGSSSIRLWQSLRKDFPGIKVINRGFGGSELADSTFYVDRIVIPYRPKMVVLYAGDNDLASGKTPQQVFEDYKAFVGRVHQKLPATRIAFISIKPSPARASLLQSMKDANGMIKAYATHARKLIYIDVFTPMLGKDGSPRPELFGPDRLHMNSEGYRLWKTVVAPSIR